MTIRQKGFTIVELLIVIVVIAILAALTIVSFNGINRRSSEAQIQSELLTLKKQLDANVITDLNYPTTVTSFTSKITDMNFEYSYDNATNPKSYCITATSTKTTNVYSVSSTSSVKTGACPGHSTTPPSGQTFTFTNFTWTQLTTRPVTQSFADIATSADGQVLVGAYSNGGNGGNIYRSNNGGTTWTTLPGAGVDRWATIDISADGQKIIAAPDGNSPGGYVTISYDAGATWTQHTSDLPQANWKSVEMTNDGSVMLAGYEIGALYISTDGGLNWTNSSTPMATARWGAIQISNDGQRAYASSVCGSNQGFATKQGSAAWIKKTATPTCANDIAASSSGQYAIISSNNFNYGLLYTSDYGVTWTDWSSKVTNSISTPLTKVSMSADGTKMFVARSGSKYVYFSKDSGETWDYRSTNTGGTSAGDAPRSAIVSGNGAVFYAETLNGIFKGTFD